MIRKKVGKCIRKYGNIGYELLTEEKRKDEIWRNIKKCDFEKFVRGIYLTISEFENSGKEKKEDISNCLLEPETGFLKYNGMKKRYEIVYCPSEEADYKSDPYYLRLCFVAFVLREDKKSLINNFMEVCFLRTDQLEIPDGQKEQFKVLLEDGWSEEIVKLYKEYAPNSSGNATHLSRCCKKVSLFLQTDAHRY